MRLKDLPNRVLRPFGLQISRLYEPPRPGYYRLSQTCQIKNLGTIYEEIFGRSTGSFVEVGAYDGESFSNVSCLADRGWRGLLVEPVPEFAAQARRRHASNPAVSVLECAVGRSQGSVVMTVAGALSTANPNMLETYHGIDWAKTSLTKTRSINVEQVLLDSILDDFGRPDVLVIDTEGYESEVMAGFTLKRWMPKVLIVELADYHPDFPKQRTESAAIRDRIITGGYGIAFKDEINTVFVRN